MSTTADGSYVSFLFHGDVFPSSKSLLDQVVDEIVSILKKEAEEGNKKSTSKERSAAEKLNQVSNLSRQYVAKDGMLIILLFRSITIEHTGNLEATTVYREKL
ncbi:19010_t:CDS:2 [Cetraspora pellucida]|uniref:19010_t:CDS:1 n=1 Tax=Cetraspora pellucida TaxID=1433469 RepID=A0A9N8VL86_9GLOM|nr:19010_t:CDS:2 [Cetraspora pellucida]